MFKQFDNNKIEICCMELLRYIALGEYRLCGICMNYPELIDKNKEKLMYCPYCGEKLNPCN